MSATRVTVPRSRMRGTGCKVSCALVIVAVSFLSAPVIGEHWPQWRGPALNGSSPEQDLPVEWGTEKNVAWKANMPGFSGATPVIWADRVFMPSGDGTGGLLALCLDAGTGKILWRRPAGKDRWFRGKRHNAATPSAVTDGKTVCFYYGTGTLLAFDFSGKPLWRRELEKEFGRFVLMWGYGSSPLLQGGRLYIPVLQHVKPGRYGGGPDPRRGPLDSFVLALDLATGKTIWKHVRPTDAQGETTESYITPMVLEGKGQPQIVINAAEYLTGHAASTGEEVWRWRFAPPSTRRDQRTVSSVTVDDGVVYFGRPKCRVFYAVEPAGGTGRLAGDVLKWTFEKESSDASTALMYRERLYLLNGRGKVLTCLKPDTGTVIWSEKLAVTDELRASPTGADGKIYCISMRGEAVVLKAGDACAVLATNRMKEKRCLSTIAVSGGRLYLRTPDYLYCIGAR